MGLFFFLKKLHFDDKKQLIMTENLAISRLWVFGSTV